MADNKTFGDFIDDMTSLDVITLTGDLTVQVKDLGPDKPGENATSAKPVKFQQLMRSLEGSILRDRSTITALAATHVSIDKDTITFVKENMTPEETVYLDFHNETVKAAGVARAAMAEGIAKLLLGRAAK